MPLKIVRESGKTWADYVRTNGSNLDKLALKILESHGKGHLACVALCVVSGKNEVLVATNGFTLDIEESKVCVKDTLGIDDVKYVTMNHLSTMHAEMKLLSSLENDYGFTADDFVGLRIGVSKPCCCLCAAVLDSYGVVYSMYHLEEMYWLSPFKCNQKDCGPEMEYQKDSDNDWHVILHFPEHFQQRFPKDFPKGTPKFLWRRITIDIIFAFLLGRTDLDSIP